MAEAVGADQRVDVSVDPPADVRADARADEVLGARSRAWRLVLLAVVTVLFLGGTAIGDDDWWPFGPWRMFATSTAPTGGVAVLAIEVTTANVVPSMDDASSPDGDPATGWAPAPLTLQNVGLNRAEVEGRVPLMTADPALLGTLSATHTRLHPDQARWTGVRVVRVETVIKDRRPTGEERRTVLAAWQATPSPKTLP